MDSMEFWDLQPNLVGFSGVLANLLHFGQPFACNDRLYFWRITTQMLRERPLATSGVILCDRNRLAYILMSGLETNRDNIYTLPGPELS